MGLDRLYLFRDIRFLPIFLVQLCGCLNDCILKNALIIFITYKLSNEINQSAHVLVLLTNTLFVLPFILFASLAGQIADRYERSTVVKIIKFLEILIIAFAIYGFINNSLIILFNALAMMGIHSTFFGAIKYSILPDHLHKNELLRANGYVEAGTFISILLGTIIGGYYTISTTFIVIVLTIFALAGFISSFFLPKSNNANPSIKISLNLLHETIEMVNYAKSKKQVYLSILGISWFWFIGAAILAQIPSLAKDILGADENVANLFLAVFSIGVGVGSFLCSKIFENEITTKYIFLACIGISIFGIDLFFASRISAINYEIEQLKSVLVFLSKAHNWRIIIDLFLIAMIGGIYIVPLYAVLQAFSAPAHRSRIIAVTNLMNSVFMAGSTIILTLLFYLGYSIPFVILVVSLLNVLVALHIYKLIPGLKIFPFAVWKYILKFIFDVMYQVEVKGLENFYNAGKRSVIIANHISYLDAAFLAVYLPEQMTFAIDTSMAKRLWVKPFLKMNRALPIDTTNAMAIKTLIKELLQDKKVAIFPEGRISITGSLMKVYEGPGMIADKANATILPVRIDGVQFTHFSKLKNMFKIRIFPKVTITILPPVKFAPQENMDSRERRKYIGQALYDIMVDMMFESSDYKTTIFQSLIEAAKLHGFNKKIIKDKNGREASYRKLLSSTFAFANLITHRTEYDEYIGLMLPNKLESTVAFYAMQASARRPVMINWTDKIKDILNACHITAIKAVYTSRELVQTNRLEEVISKINNANIKIFYLEDLQKEINWKMKIRGFIGSFFPQTYYNNTCINQNEEDPAVVLFSSASDNIFKAIVLSHKNLQASRCQVLSKVHFSPKDIAFIMLPMFDCLGLIGAVIMPLNGINTFLYPTPLHYRIIPEEVYDVGATIMFATDTLLNTYSQYAHPYDFYSIRLIFACGEKLQTSTRQLWLDKYGIRIFESYSIPEASPFIAINTPMHNRPMSAGRLMPKIEYIVQAVEGIKQGGRLFIKGPNIMLGYMLADNPKIINPIFSNEYGDGWFDTQDIVQIDEDGYISVLNKAK